MMSGDNLQRVIDALSDGVYITDGHGVTVTVNKAYERITRIPRSALVGLHMSEVVQRGYISRSVSLEVLKEQGPVTLTQTIGNDHNILVSGTPMFDPQGRLEYIVTTVRDVTELLQAKRAEEQLEQILHVRDHYGAHEANDAVIISRATQRCYDLAKRVAPTAAKVLIQGETGTGKTLLARTIHDYSAVAQGPFIELNCAAMPESLLEAELFGYVPGAFTGAAQKGKTGLLEAANNGTLFLDEIGDLPLSLQAKLLKVIAENRFIPVGGIQFKNTNFRLISATHHNLHELVAQHQFREDLLYRLSVVPLELPPLRERAEEVEALLQHYLSHFNAKYEFDCRWHSDVIARLQRYHWPGNIRELINLTERLVVTAEQSLITTAQLPREMRVDTGFTALGMGLKEQVEGLERELIEQALAMYGTTRQAAAALGIDQSTLVKKQQRWRAQQAVENRNTVEFKDV
ncbi:sigma 54-interacting transcriptional regulator [Pseudidiomarina sp. GXY010]|uniref:HTH-type transcriptional regulatory protein TyrR n=1 Tax=Pseudidiomarina fusca TaxID=2965078 RepID=A0ABU3KW79_9GAMM|nr:sigma 54-interacting transcriptional regulator [Pseudidiomarina sp. GXY010]MDT7525396.1 sigma 54-interacting transcriptional regulator [Pseudidiomarina sp. GXY010]